MQVGIRGKAARKPASPSRDDHSSSNPPEKKSGAARGGHYRLRIFREKIAFWTSVAMIPDRDIFRSAQVLVKRHGQDAPIEAAMRADAMLEKGGKIVITV